LLQRRALPLGWKQNRENRSAEGSEEITIQNGIEDHLPSMMHGTATCFFFFLKYYSFLRSFIPSFLRSFLPSLFLVLAALGCGRLSLPRATKRPCGYAVHVCLGVVVCRRQKRAGIRAVSACGQKKMQEPNGGFEPPTFRLRSGCSATELIRCCGIWAENHIYQSPEAEAVHPYSCLLTPAQVRSIDRWGGALGSFLLGRVRAAEPSFG
jgi:hypothetical protein